MNRRAAVVILALLMLSVVPSSVFADAPALSATPIPGKEIDVTGSGSLSPLLTVIAIPEWLNQVPYTEVSLRDSEPP